MLAPQHEGVFCFNTLDLILRRPPTGRAYARPMTGSAAVSKDGLLRRFVSKKCGIGRIWPIAENYFKYKMIADRALPDALDFFEPLIPK